MCEKSFRGTDSVIKYHTHKHNSKKKTQNKTCQRDYCCLQFSFFSLGFERAGLSVCRLVGGMNVGSSRGSRMPDGVMGRDWLPDPVVQRERKWATGDCYHSFILRALFVCVNYRTVPPHHCLGPVAWPGRLGPTPLRCSSYAEFACQRGAVSQRNSTRGHGDDVWFRWRHLHGGGGTGRQVFWAAILSGRGKTLWVKPLSLDLSKKKKVQCQ